MAHVGTVQQREELAAALTGVKVDIVRQFARQVLVFKMSGVYLLLIGSVRSLRSSALAPALGASDDDALVYKWGRTGDLDLRLQKHKQQYGCLKGAELKLTFFAPIDPRFQSTAEKDAADAIKRIGTYLTGVKLRGEAKKELVVMHQRDVSLAAKELFTRLGAQYAGCLKDMQDELEKSRLLGEQKDVSIRLQSDTVAEQRDTIKEQHDTIKEQRGIIREQN